MNNLMTLHKGFTHLNDGMCIKKKYMSRLTLLLFLCIVGITATNGQTAPNWPSLHGSDRSNKSTETGLLESWPEDGPSLLWKATGIGEGYSSVIIADGLVYTSGKSENQTYVFAFDMDGKLAWKKPNGSAWDVEVSWASSYSGSRSTPTYDNGVIYHLSEAGRLTAYKSKSGDVIWSRDLTTDFMAEIPTYGYSESVLIDGNNLFVRPAGEKAFQVCLNKQTGETIWVNTSIPGTHGYNSLVMHDFGGYRQVIGASSNCYYGVDSKTGKLLWKVDFENTWELNCTDAAIFNEYVYLTNEGNGSMLIKLKYSGTTVTTEEIWQNKLLDNYHGGVIIHNGYVYGSGSKSRSWVCLELLTGKQMWKTSGTGSLTFADGMLYLFDDKGSVKLAKASAGAFEKTGEFKLSSGGKGPYWAHPVVSGGRMYLRHADAIYAYEIKAD